MGQESVTDAEGALYPFPAPNQGLRLGGAGEANKKNTICKKQRPKS